MFFKILLEVVSFIILVCIFLGLVNGAVGIINQATKKKPAAKKEPAAEDKSPPPNAA